MDDYGHFYSENKARIFAYLLRLTGDYQLSNDLMQESFTRYLSRYGCKGNNRALLYTIARNAALDAVRKCREDIIRRDEEVSPVGDPEHKLIEKQGYHQLIAAIQKLNVLDRELIALLATETFSYRQIGNLLGISEANVKVKVHRARLKLKALLKNGGH